MYVLLLNFFLILILVVHQVDDKKVEFHWQRVRYIRRYRHTKRLEIFLDSFQLKHSNHLNTQHLNTGLI